MMLIRRCCTLLLGGSAAVALVLLSLGPRVALAYPTGFEAVAANAPHAAIDAPFIRIERLTNTDNVNLSWSHESGTDAYEVYRSTQPYPTPGLAPANRIYDLPASANGQGQTVNRKDDGIDNYPADGALTTVQVIGNPSTNYFWVVQGRTNAGDVSGGSNIVGEFDFALVKGG